MPSTFMRGLVCSALLRTTGPSTAPSPIAMKIRVVPIVSGTSGEMGMLVNGRPFTVAGGSNALLSSLTVPPTTSTPTCSLAAWSSGRRTSQ